MAKGEKKGCFKACCITVVVVFALVLALGAFVLLYTPKAATLADKLSGNEALTVIYYEEGESVPSENVLGAVIFLKTASDTDYEIKDVVEYSTQGLTEDDPDYIWGVIVYTDSIGSAYNIMIDYIKFLMDRDGEDAKLLEIHCSPRGNALFVGNLKAELEFRKVIF